MSATAAEARTVFELWHRYARDRQVSELAGLYAEDAILESPLVPRILDIASGRLEGREQIQAFFAEGTRRRPNPLVRWYRSDRYLFDGNTLMWEYPRDAPDGDQVDILEVVDLDGSLIRAHRIYWGWFGTELLIGNAVDKAVSHG